MKSLIIFSILWSGILCFLFTPTSRIKGDVLEYYNDYKQIYRAECGEPYKASQEEIEFTKLIPPTIGICYMKPFGFKIQLDKDFWGYATDGQRREVLFHEFGHCILHKFHSDEVGNYMYYQSNSLSSMILNEQVRQDIRTFCSKE